ncbi:hypothetical protein [Runella sp.]|uniref:hypothetical protein n=1 Tax=Runella sp. TaxID=1960881 RepID=UPI003D117F8D
MEKYVKTSRLFFLCGYFFISLFAIILLLTSLSFFCHISLSYWHFPLSVLLAFSLNYFSGYHLFKDRTLFFKSLAIIVAVMITSITIAVLVYDVSYDGQAYHQETLIQLKNGWNPYFDLLPTTVNQALYINHYSKGAEISEAAIYLFLNKIESGKALNIMLLFAAFSLTFSLLLQIIKLPILKIILISLFLSLNPIVVNQLLTYYVDGQLGSILQCMLVSSLFIIIYPTRYYFLLFAFTVIVLVNTKFTSVVYAVLLLFCFIGWIFFNRRHLLYKIIIVSAISGIIGVVLVGFNPYVKNLYGFGHPFYPVMGKNKADILTYNFPATFINKNTFEKFYISLFAHTGNPTSTNGKEVKLKIPFTFNKEDIISASKIDARIAGFGPLFSGILVVSFLLLCVLLFFYQFNRIIKNTLFLSGILLISSLVNPESWWARYIPQFWYIPIIILLAGELMPTKYNKVFKGILYLSLAVNIGFTFIGIGWNIFMTGLINYQMDKLKYSEEIVTVEWGSAKSNRIRFEEKGVPYLERKLDGLKIENVIRSDSRFIVPEKSKNVTKPPILIWAQKFIPEGK